MTSANIGVPRPFMPGGRGMGSTGYLPHAAIDPFIIPTSPAPGEDPTQLAYVPPPTVERFMLDGHLVRFIVGPVGSGKSMGCIMELLRRARQQVADANGRRSTRFALIRNTMQQLRTTVLSDVMQYLNPMLRYFVTDSTIQIRADLEDGTAVHSDWVMIPLDTKEDVRRLLSMQLTGAWINEVREVPYEIVSALLERLGRFPSKLNGGPTWHGLIADSNPWDVDSPYHEALVLNPDPKWKLFHQPSGVSPEAENLENLPDGYYENAMSGSTEERIATQIRSEWGTSNAGQAVFRRSFDANTHVVDMETVVNPMRPLLVAMDFGRTPCALIGQVDTHGRYLIFEEIVTDDMGLHQMLAERLRPRLMNEPYAGKRSYVVADPAGAQRSQYSEETAFDVLKSHGFLAYPGATNDIPPRLLAVEKLLRQQIMGQPGLQISRLGCPVLIRAMASQYHYRRRRDGHLDEKPEKNNHPYSDVADALQYGCLSVQADLTGRAMRSMMPRVVQTKRISSGGWT
jgi:hypothetical protein